jgi:hypothetical protein
MAVANGDPQQPRYVVANVPMTFEQLRTEFESLATLQLQRKINPYWPFLQFHVLLIAFCTAIIVGVFNALPKGNAPLLSPGQETLGAVLMWISITAVLATFTALCLQCLRNRYAMAVREGIPNPTEYRKCAIALCVIPALTGLIAVLYCVRGGAAMLAGAVALLDLGTVLHWLAFWG